MNMQSVNPENLQTSIAKIYQTFGLTEDKAALLADTLVIADLWGHSSHGVMRTS
jgi:LDH2 family malate/lactate/ureidoglycolate dehydrogenase